MNAQPIRYARSADGHDVAYWQAGSGPTLLTSGVGHVRAAHDFELPVFAEFYQRLIERFRVVRFDERQVLSGSDRYGLSDWGEDLLAVASAAGVDRFSLLTVWPSGSQAAVYVAHQYPDRVSRLVLWSPGLEAPEPLVVIGQLQQKYPDLGRELRLFLAGFDESVREWVRQHETERAQIPSLALSATLDQLLEWTEQVAPLLGELRLPVLLMYRRDALTDYGAIARPFAASIPGASLMPVDGKGTSIVADEQEAIVSMIEAFVAERGLEDGEAETGGGGASMEERLARLSARELEVLKLVAEDLSNPQIAVELGLSPSTVASHVRSILAKTERSSRAGAVKYATDHGLFEG